MSHIITHFQPNTSLLNSSLGGVNTNEYSTLSLAKALASMCDKYMSSKDNISYNGRFLCDSGWYSYNVYHSGSYWSGFVVHITQDKSYSFRRLAGADAVLKESSSSKSFKIKTRAYLSTANEYNYRSCYAYTYIYDSNGNLLHTFSAGNANIDTGYASASLDTSANNNVTL